MRNETWVEVRRVDVFGGLKLYKEALFEHFKFVVDEVKLIVHHPLSHNLYAFGTKVRSFCICRMLL